MKILILGTQGTGKTYLSRKISNQTNINRYPLDLIAKHPDREAKLSKIIKNKNWIIEGSYNSSWIYPTIKKADKIIILNTHSLLIKKRIYSRLLAKTLNLQKSNKNIISYFPQMRKIANPSKKRKLIIYQNILNSNNKTPLIFSTKKQINNFLEELK